MRSDAITPAKRRGRRLLSPNGIDREMRQAHQRRHRKMAKPNAGRWRTELRKRQQDKLRRARRKQLRRRSVTCYRSNYQTTIDAGIRQLPKIRWNYGIDRVSQADIYS